MHLYKFFHRDFNSETFWLFGESVECGDNFDVQRCTELKKVENPWTRVSLQTMFCFYIFYKNVIFRGIYVAVCIVTSYLVFVDALNNETSRSAGRENLGRRKWHFVTFFDILWHIFVLASDLQYPSIFKFDLYRYSQGNGYGMIITLSNFRHSIKSPYSEMWHCETLLLNFLSLLSDFTTDCTSICFIYLPTY